VPGNSPEAFYHTTSWPGLGGVRDYILLALQRAYSGRVQDGTPAAIDEQISVVKDQFRTIHAEAFAKMPPVEYTIRSERSQARKTVVPYK